MFVETLRIRTQRHQMSVNGKFDGITLADLREVGDRQLVPDYENVIAEVLAAVDGWLDFAREAGVSNAKAERVATDIEINSVIRS